MGGLREWAQQASGQPATGYEKHVFHPWEAIVYNLPSTTGDPTTVTTSYSDYRNFFGHEGGESFNIAAELFAIRDENGGNPFSGVTAYDPAPHIKRVEDALRKLGTEVESRTNDRPVRDSARLAVQQAKVLLPEDSINDAVAAERERMRYDYIESKSSMYVDLWLHGGILTSQLGGDLAVIEDGFNTNVNAYATKLRLAREDKRAEIAMRIMEVSITQGDRMVTLRQVYAAVAMDVLKVSMTAGRDWIDKGLEYKNAQKFWNVNLLLTLLNANSAIYGAQMTQRAQTRGERLSAAVQGSFAAGIQGGMAMGNPAAGAAFGGFQFLSQMLLQ